MRIHIVYPEDRHVESDVVMGWASDAFADGDIEYMPTDINDAMSLLEDTGKVTFSACLCSQPNLTHGVPT